MTSISFKTAFAATIVASAALASTSASALVLNTTGLKANATLQFSVEAFGAATAAGVKFAPLGNTTQLANVVATEPAGTLSVAVFALPVTKADVAIGWDLSIKPTSGQSSGAALRLSTPEAGGDAVLANFDVDFVGKVVYADLMDVYLQTTEKRVPVYSFDEVKPQVISFKGFVLNQKSYLGNLVFVPSVIDKLAEALLINPVLRPGLASAKWGTINVEVTSYKRPNKITNTPYTLDKVPAL